MSPLSGLRKEWIQLMIIGIAGGSASGKSTLAKKLAEAIADGIKAAKPDVAIPLYDKFIAALEKELDNSVGKGIFGADMKVDLLNDGPVTIIVDSKLKF